MLIIRSVVPTDFQQWQPLWEGYNRFYERHPFPADVTLAIWSRFFDGNEPVHALVAENDGKLIGLAHYLFHRSTSQIELNCYLQDLYTDESMRGQGIGRRLIDAVCERAKIAKAPLVYWQTRDNNVTARKLYDKVAKLSDFVEYVKPL